MRYKTKVKCGDCGKRFSPQGLVGHRRTHKPKGQKVTCEICGKQFSRMGIGTHKWRAHGAGRNHKPTAPGVGHPAWNKGKTKETDSRVARNSRAVARTVRKKVKGGWSPKGPGQAAREATAKRMSQNNPGGRCKWFKVDGRTVQGTWERDMALKMCDLGIPWKRTVEKGNRSWFYHDDAGKRRWYTPDFYLPESDLQLEVKGYWWGRDKQKMAWVLEQNPTARIAIIEEKLFRALLAEPSKEGFLQLLC